MGKEEETYLCAWTGRSLRDSKIEKYLFEKALPLKGFIFESSASLAIAAVVWCFLKLAIIEPSSFELEYPFESSYICARYGLLRGSMLEVSVFCLFARDPPSDPGRLSAIVIKGFRILTIECVE